MDNRKLEIFLADDHQNILPGLKMAIESVDGFHVTGSATDGLDAYNGIMELRPDIAVLDLSIPVINGFEITRKLRENKNKVKVIILTSYSNDEYIREAMKIKVDGYLLKEDSSKEILTALETVASGCSYITPKIMKKIADGLCEKEFGQFSLIISETITETEYDVFKHISDDTKMEGELSPH